MTLSTRGRQLLQMLVSDAIHLATVNPQSHARHSTSKESCHAILFHHRTGSAQMGCAKVAPLLNVHFHFQLFSHSTLSSNTLLEHHGCHTSSLPGHAQEMPPRCLHVPSLLCMLLAGNSVGVTTQMNLWEHWPHLPETFNVDSAHSFAESHLMLQTELSWAQPISTQINSPLCK